MATNETTGIILIWKIENFSYCPQKEGEKLESPIIEGDTGSWCLGIYPRGTIDGYTSYFVFRATDAVENAVEISFDISLVAVDCRLKTRIVNKVSVEKLSGKGYPNFISHSEVFGRKGPGFLKNDTLTAMCRIWEINGKVPNPKQHFALTRIEINSQSFVSTIPDFAVVKNMEVKTIEKKELPLNLNIFKNKTGGRFSKNKLHIQILPNQFFQNRYYNFKNVLSTCKIFVLDDNGQEAISELDEHWVNKSTTWQFPLFIDVDKLLAKKSILLPGGVLSLRFEITISEGTVYNKLIHTRQGDCAFNNIEGIMKSMESDFYAVGDMSNSVCPSLVKNVVSLYKDQKYCDSTIEAGGKEFAVHKSILCTRSPVFNAMFARNMQENQTGIVKIPDLDEETVHQMLLFLYGDATDDLTYELALKLYFAADKYDLKVLKQNCSSVIKSNLEPSNVYQALALADLHQDQKMASFVRDYIKDNGQEVLTSDEWKAFMQSNADLAGRTMHLLCMTLLNV